MMPGSDGSGASAISSRCSRPSSRRTISAAVFLRGNSPKNSSRYWISRAPCSSGYCLIRYSTAGQGFGSASAASAVSSICQSASGCGPGVIPARSGSSPERPRPFVRSALLGVLAPLLLLALALHPRLLPFALLQRWSGSIRHASLLRRRRTRGRTGATPCARPIRRSRAILSENYGPPARGRRWPPRI